ncbi:hypothetical protein GCM10011581_23830 [Saccharopolyspora subtropica]|uniref:Uncharacterized protein n=1 Tax=Saccharopolyspora thermophila TaxID=89367 RepID=A0A917JVP1_9PSEU|nr:hypothetical protein [Saccharopolyspora subtropica]GGI85969.1 hypothetical protein GCM10011581_23830 [Saccharopolyspora subtropica]
MTGAVVVRFAPGVVGESRRQAHLAHAPEHGIPEFWSTFCGLRIPAEQAEVSTRPAGMPCVRCLSGGFPTLATPALTD